MAEIVSGKQAYFFSNYADEVSSVKINRSIGKWIQRFLAVPGSFLL
jgi:hypothetical protein